MLLDARSRDAVECAEGYADGLTTKSALEAARSAAAAACEPRLRAFDIEQHRAFVAAEAARCAARPTSKLTALVDDARKCSESALQAEMMGRLGRLIRAECLLPRCNLLRCLFGPTAFRPVSIDPACLTNNVVRLAAASYNERTLPSGHLDATRLAVLADAVEEAGGQVEIVEHLRAAGPHYRGCFAVDAVLGKA